MLWTALLSFELLLRYSTNTILYAVIVSILLLKLFGDSSSAVLNRFTELTLGVLGDSMPFDVVTERVRIIS